MSDDGIRYVTWAALAIGVLAVFFALEIILRRLTNWYCTANDWSPHRFGSQTGARR